jgi:3alpha(or 20beta)-hydroxysteroid dehydrogenase
VTDSSKGPRVAIVTGAAGGIGSAICTLLEHEGWRLVATDVIEPAREHPGTVCIAHDVTDAESWDRVVDRTLSEHGGPTGLVNVAGIIRRAVHWEMTDEDWADVVAVNQTGVFYGLRAVSPVMRAAGRGSIVNISSVAGLTGFTNSIGYVASKFAVTGLTKAAAMELGEYGVRVNSVHPGTVDTGMPSGLGPKLPINRYGLPAEVAELVLFLLSERSSYCTGGQYVVDGGMLSGRYRR